MRVALSLRDHYHFINVLCPHHHLYTFYDSSALLYTVTGLNRECGYLYTKTYSDTDIYFSDAIRRYRYLYGALSPFEDYVRYISTS